MNNPLVTFCVPTYNRPDFLRQTLESCLAQTYRDFEIVITDNSTNDESARMVTKLNDPRVRYHSNNGNIGSLASHNRLASMIQGKYVQFLMDDDLIKPRFLELMVGVFEQHPTVGVVMAPMELIDENGRRIYPRFYIFRKMQCRYRYQVGDGLIPRKRVLRDYLTRDYPCTVPSGILFRTAALMPTLPFDGEADFAGDLNTSMKIATSWDFYYLDQILSSWRFTPTCHTATLHQQGSKIQAFYYVSRGCLENKAVKELFHDEWERLVRDSYFFCTRRAMMLNGMAALRSLSPRLFIQTVKVVLKEDPYRFNLLRLPFFVMRDVFVSLFPPKLPPPRVGNGG
jgi:glycosyltransferase involved in cell wall biosynthesis